MDYNNAGEILGTAKEYLIQRGFPNFDSPGLLQPKFGYAFSPSAGHHIIDEVVISQTEPQPVLRFSTIPDRSMRTYDFSKIGISKRHLSFFETMVFGYSGAKEKLPKEEAVREFYDLSIKLGLDPGRMLVTVPSPIKLEGTEIDEKEDKPFYDQWVDLLGEDKVKKTTGRRNIFYSRKIGNPGGAGCELYYKIGEDYVEIGSQVNYRYKFTGGLEKTRNAAILQGFGLERLLMALENQENIGNISLFQNIKNTLKKSLNEDTSTSNLYDENLTKISDHVRAISFILHDSNGIDLTNSQTKILKKLIGETKSELNYLGINNPTIYGSLVNSIVKVYGGRYPLLDRIGSKIVQTIRGEHESL